VTCEWYSLPPAFPYPAYSDDLYRDGCVCLFTICDDACDVILICHSILFYSLYVAQCLLWHSDTVGLSCSNRLGICDSLKLKIKKNCNC